MIETYTITHFHGGEITIEVDEELCSTWEDPHHDNIWDSINEFWSGAERRAADAPTVKEAVLKLLGRTALVEAFTHDWNLRGLLSAFQNMEGWPPMDGSYGIKIVGLEPIDPFDDSDFYVTLVVK